MRFLFLLICAAINAHAAVNEVHLHIDPPLNGIELSNTMDLADVTKIGIPEGLAPGIVLTAPETVGTLLDLNAVIKQHGPVKFILDIQSPQFIVVPHARLNVFTLFPDRAGLIYSSANKVKINRLAKDAAPRGVKHLLKWLNFLSLLDPDKIFLYGDYDAR